jgi:hypothetical protein
LHAALREVTEGGPAKVKDTAGAAA